MPQTNFRSYIIGFIIITLFIFLALSFAVDTGAQYGKTDDEITGGALDLSLYEDNLQDVQTTSEGLRQRFEKGGVFAITGVIVSGIFDVGKSMVTLVFTPFGLIAQIMENIIGVPPLVTSVILGTLVLAIIFSLWRVVKLGD